MKINMIKYKDTDIHIYRGAIMKEFKSGFVAVVGRPNVGKSTLVNKLIGEKIAIMSDKPQTTRTKISCILTTEESQIIFVDTPGIHKPQHKLGEFMVKSATNSLKEVDVVLFVVDVTEKSGKGEEFIIDVLNKVKKPVILVLNKIDKFNDKAQLLSAIDFYRKQYDFAGFVPLSALTETDFAVLVQEIEKILPVGPMYYDEDMITDQPVRLIAAELVREKALQLTRDEIPHSLAVEIDEMTTRANGNVYIRATIYVERESQKGIVIGDKGKLLREIGQQAREDIQKLIDSKVFLDLWVKVRKDWRNQDRSLKEFGYKED